MAVPIKVIGICGREGSGKSTVANLILDGYELRYKWKKECIRDYIYDQLGLSGGRGDTDQGSSIDWLLRGFFHNIDLNEVVECPYLITEDQQMRLYSFSDPLKRIVCMSMDFYYPSCDRNDPKNIINKHDLFDILLGGTPENRVLREEILCYNPPFPRYTSIDIKPMTGREALEYVGTYIFRENFCNDIWLNLFKAEIRGYPNTQFVIPDCRFENEINFVKELGKMFIVYCEESELQITENDLTKHISKYNFLNFLSDDMIRIDNSLRSIISLKTKLVSLGLSRDF